jgi:ribonuclease HI
MANRFILMIRAWFKKSRYDIYTDGSFKQGRGSWAFVIVLRGVVVLERSGYVRKSNSLRMELQAAIEALHGLTELAGSSSARLFSDSRIVVDAMASGSEVAESRPNAALINDLRLLSLEHRIEWTWIKAHSGQIYNERCDELCVRARQLGGPQGSRLMSRVN